MFGMKLMFKIDLIVWKLDETNLNKCIAISKFKIDLIVWKCFFWGRELLKLLRLK